MVRGSNSFFSSSEFKNPIESKLTWVINKLIDNSLKPEAKTTLMNENDYYTILKENEFIAKYGSRLTLQTHAVNLLSFLARSQDTPNHGLMTAIYDQFKALCPSDLITEMNYHLDSADKVSP